MPTIKPEFFNYDMTRAILDGRKTATRRIVKAGGHKVEKLLYPEPTRRDAYPFSAYNCRLEKNVGLYLTPRHHHGDIIYVRETFAEVSHLSGISDIDGPVYMADFSPEDLKAFKENGIEVEA